MAAPMLEELADVSARIGADPLLVQGPGGNSSLKEGDRLWVKASGRWLAEARARPIFVPLSLAAVRAQLARGNAEDFGAAILPGLAPDDLRPSIETALHALLPHAVVFHAHAVNSLATSLLADGRDRAAAALAPLRFAWVDYCRPGLPLARAVEAAIGDGPVDVIMLRNHGIVVGAESPGAAADLLAQVEQRLHLSPRPGGEADTALLSRFVTEAYEPHPLASILALDPELFRIVTAGALFPDQVVFLGGAVPAIAPDETTKQAAARIETRTGVSPALLLIDGIGAVATRDRTPSAEQLILGLAEVALRLPAGAKCSALGDVDVAALLGWGAEHYRLRLAAAS